MDKKRVLVVDDEPSFTRIVRLSLEKTGFYQVKEENHARRAALTAKEFSPHVILLDVVMPGIDGGDVATEIKSYPALKNVPIIFITAIVAKGEGGASGQISGGHLFLAKPISVKGLVDSIEGELAKATGQKRELRPDLPN